MTSLKQGYEDLYFLIPKCRAELLAFGQPTLLSRGSWDMCESQVPDCVMLNNINSALRIKTFCILTGK